MTATPYECLEYIIKCEEEYKDLHLNWNKPQEEWISAPMVFYHFKRDYSYLDIKTYSQIGELYKRIVDSVNKRGEKWLIFIDDKRRCETIKKDLEEYGEDNKRPMFNGDKGTIFAVDANSKEDETYQMILANEKLGNKIKILISTSVLDNGINLRDIDNIVVSSMERVKCLQMIGRARTDENHAKKTVFIKRFNKDYVNRRIADFEEQRDAYHKYDLAYGERNIGDNGVNKFLFLEKYYNYSSRDWENAKHWFGRTILDPEKLYLNEIARSLVERLVSRYKVICDEMENEYRHIESGESDIERAKKIGQSYLDFQLSWFGKTYNLADDITFEDKEKAQKEFLDFLATSEKSDQEIAKDEQMAFRTEFTRLYDAAYERADPNLGRKYSICKSNSLLEDKKVPYKIAKCLSYWKVEKYDWETDDSE